ncbi:hypothetical protein LHJ74_27780 [Streptomyces sp. N2-109]|uniref:Integral membrane protein n=1 Tax=Streptomyces gossypii TaxID=2883101 RepID=A0ABT2K0I5_9ACTN|nr:hypothetical protein [Streptomyces gossypii]MCT2593660.1 hypothetical protein [Streptomyces gossypii]
MGRGSSYALARVAVYLRAAAGAWWWTGVAAGAIGMVVPGWSGRRIGVMAGIVLFLLVAVVTYAVRRRRYAGLLGALTTAGKWVVLRDRKVTLREWRQVHRWWLALGFVLAVASSVVLPGAGGAVLAGVGAGLWAKSVWLGRWELRNEQLLWVRPEWADGRSPVRKQVRGWMTTGPLAGDAVAGGARRRAGGAPGTARAGAKAGAGSG